MKTRETSMTSYGFNGFVLPKIFRAIFYLFYDATGLKVGGTESGRGIYRTPLNVGSKVPAKRIRSIQVRAASNGVILKIGR